jgi:MSHA pilin protein MshD
MCTLCPRARGFTLTELVVLIVVIAFALAGVMLAFSTAVGRSADPLPYKQALAIAEGLLDEIQLSSYAAQPGGGANRQDFDDVLDYNGYTTAGGMVGINGVAIPGLGAYNVAPPIIVATPGLNGVAEAMLITVSVTGPNNLVVTVSGYRVNYP